MNDQQKKLAAGGAFAVIAALVLYFELHDPSPPPPAPPAAVVSRPAAAATVSSSTSGPVLRTSAAATAKGPLSGSQQLDPTLHMGAMLLTESLAYSGSGRNIFSGGSVAAAALASVPKPIAPARPKQVFTTTVQMPSGPPPPPPIDLKFFGTETRGGGQRQAFLLRGEDVFLASAGEIVQRRYKVLSIAPGSIVVEDLLNNNRQTLPLTN